MTYPYTIALPHFCSTSEWSHHLAPLSLATGILSQVPPVRGATYSFIHKRRENGDRRESSMPFYLSSTATVDLAFEYSFGDGLGSSHIQSHIAALSGAQHGRYNHISVGPTTARFGRSGSILCRGLLDGQSGRRRTTIVVHATTTVATIANSRIHQTIWW
jgi:hypothetical protein